MIEHTSEARSNAALALWTPDLVKDAWVYWLDAFQRGVLFLDVMRQRSQHREEHIAKLAPHVLKFGAELVMDGRTLPRPVNYVLARITPPAGVKIDENKRESPEAISKPARSVHSLYAALASSCTGSSVSDSVSQY